MHIKLPAHKNECHSHGARGSMCCISTTFESCRQDFVSHNTMIFGFMSNYQIDINERVCKYTTLLYFGVIMSYSYHTVR